MGADHAVLSTHAIRVECSAETRCRPLTGNARLHSDRCVLPQAQTIVIAQKHVSIFGRLLCYATGPLSCVPVCNVGVLWPNGWIDEDATWCGGRPRPRRHCVRRGPCSPTEKGTAAPPTFQPMSIVAKRSPILATAELFLY